MKKVVLVALMLIGCGGSKSAVTLEATLPGGGTERIEFAAVDAVGDSYPTYSDGQITQEFKSSQSTKTLGDKPSLRIYLRARVTSVAAAPHSSENTPHGIGLVVGDVYINGGNVTAGELDVTRYRWTGNGGHPVEIQGKFTLPMGTGTFSMVSDCTDSVGSSIGTFLCGGNSGNAPKTDFLIKSFSGTNVCPKEVFEAFVGKLETLSTNAVKYTPTSSLEVTGARVKYSCALTRSSNSTICGAEALDIEADGCKWDAFSLFAPNQTAGVPSTFWVGARAKEGCQRAITFCNTDLFTN